LRSVDAFKEQMNTTTAGIQGSGWGWLAKAKKLEIVTTPNQDCVLTPLPCPPRPLVVFLARRQPTL